MSVNLKTHKIFCVAHSPEFDNMFDEQGNFAPLIENEEPELKELPKSPEECHFYNSSN